MDWQTNTSQDNGTISFLVMIYHIIKSVLVKSVSISTPQNVLSCMLIIANTTKDNQLFDLQVVLFIQMLGG